VGDGVTVGVGVDVGVDVGDGVGVLKSRAIGAPAAVIRGALVALPNTLLYREAFQIAKRDSTKSTIPSSLILNFGTFMYLQIIHLSI
jgi:hypothetical protein